MSYSDILTLSKGLISRVEQAICNKAKEPAKESESEEDAPEENEFEETDFEAYKLGIYTDLSLIDINKYNPEEAINHAQNTIDNHIKNKKFSG